MSDTQSVFSAIAAVLVFAAAASYINHQFLRLPTTIALMAISLAVSLTIVALGTFHVIDSQDTRDFVDSLHFDEVLLHGLLGYLLFAGALHIDLGALKGAMVQISTLASLSVVLSAVLAGTMFFAIGWLKSIVFARPHAIRSGLSTLATGSAAASLAFLTGYLLRQAFGIG